MRKDVEFTIKDTTVCLSYNLRSWALPVKVGRARGSCNFGGSDYVYSAYNLEFLCFGILIDGWRHADGN